MQKINMTAVCNYAASVVPMVQKDWGFSFMVDGEFDALRIAYAYRNNPHGVKVEHCPNVDQFMVTVFNEVAAAAGIDGAK